MSRYTAAELLANADAELSRAYGLLGDAADWIRYADVPFTAEQAARRKAMLDGFRQRRRRSARRDGDRPRLTLDRWHADRHRN